MNAARASILLVTDSREPSGVGRHMLDLAAALGDRYSLIVAAAATPMARTFLEHARRAGLEVWELPDAERSVQAASLAARLTESPVDLLHVHAGIAWEGHEVVQAARGAGTAAIVRTEHCPYVLTKAVDDDLYADGIRAVDRIVCVSHGVADTFRAAGVPGSLLSVVLNGIGEQRAATPAADVRDALGVQPDAPLAVTVARLTEQKGHLDLLAAIPRILERVAGARFVWIGDGPLEDRLSSAIRVAGLDRYVSLLPRHADIPALLAAADVVVLPSRFEGLPLVALEAMAAGTPVVGTAVVGLEETIRDRGTGRLVASGDTDGLADAVTEALSNPELARSWGHAGRAWQQEVFTAERMAAETAGVYDEVLESVRGGAQQVLVAAHP